MHVPFFWLSNLVAPLTFGLVSIWGTGSGDDPDGHGPHIDPEGEPTLFGTDGGEGVGPDIDPDGGDEATP